jgi:hypothetical protein
MKNKKAHINAPCMIMKAILILSASYLTFMLATNRAVPTQMIAGFAVIIFFAQFINMMFGMNPLGMIFGMFIALFSLIMLKTVYSYPSSGIGQFFIRNTLYIAPTVVIIDILRDLID